MSDAAARLAASPFVVTAGGTREPIDPVRYLGNRSSGRMGNAIARAAADAGAPVTLVTAAPPPADANGIAVVSVDTAQQMLDAVLSALDGACVLVMAAAVADYRPEREAATKLKKRSAPWDLRLVPAVDILLTVRDSPLRSRLLVVGFAAETDDPVRNAQAKLAAKGLDLIVVNDVSQPGIGMGAEDNEVTVIDAAGIVEVVPRAPKSVVANRLLAIVGERLR